MPRIADKVGGQSEFARYFADGGSSMFKVSDWYSRQYSTATTSVVVITKAAG
jgi:hypothetical protein